MAPAEESEPVMPICPKCGKLISEGHLERHLRRHGSHHRQHRNLEPYVNTVVPSYERVGPRGVLVNAPARKHKMKKRKGLLRRALGV